MALGNINNYSSLATILNRSGQGRGQDRSQAARIQSVFDARMNMTRQLFDNGQDEAEENSSPGSFDVSMVNDSMMLEALAAISRLMRDQPGDQSHVVPQRGKRSPAEPAGSPVKESPSVPGTLSARFESGEDGVGAIGYDRVGGTSYGKYQIASKPGTMERFLNYLDREAPEWAGRLRSAGPADTGSTKGAMPAAWKSIAAENPQKFETLQHGFIAGETYNPAREMILGQTGYDFENASPALQEVLWSTSVQHGATGAARIFNKVIDRFVNKNDSEDFGTQLIKGVYEARKAQFGSSSARVQRSVANRMDDEKQLALQMLSNTKLSQIV